MDASPAEPSSPDGDRRRGASRRALLAGGAAVLIAGAGGGLAGVLATPRRRPAPEPAAPPALLAALEQERALLATLGAAAPGTAPHDVLHQIRSDHLAHLDALRGAVAEAIYPAAHIPTPSGTPSRHRRAGRNELRAAEQAAATAGGRRAERLHGAVAALLASIAACEATHAELLA